MASLQIKGNLWHLKFFLTCHTYNSLSASEKSLWPIKQQIFPNLQYSFVLSVHDMFNLQEHRSQSCDTYMIEQALAIATSDGGTTQATIQIPSHFTVDTQQLIQVDGQRVSIDKDGQITVGQPDIPGMWDTQFLADSEAWWTNGRFGTNGSCDIQIKAIVRIVLHYTLHIRLFLEPPNLHFDLKIC